MSLSPLTTEERALLNHVTMFGSGGYPIQKLGTRWVWQDAFGVHGPPMCYLTKKAAVAAFEGWVEFALMRLRATSVEP